MYFSQKLNMRLNVVIFMLLITGSVSFSVSGEDNNESKKRNTQWKDTMDRVNRRNYRPSPISFPGCGLRSTASRANLKDSIFDGAVPFIVGGKKSTPHSWPWMVALWKNGMKKHLCGASLISKKYVLTAAHCFKSVNYPPDPSNFTVRLGSDTTMGAEYSIEKILVHPKYRNKIHYNDIALLKIKGKVKLANNIKPICLPSEDLKAKTKKGNHDVIVAGWGDTKEIGGQNSKTLQEVKIPVVDNKECGASYSKIVHQGMGLPKGITPELICAGLKEGGKDACKADSGGPLVWELKDGSWVQLGIVSFGFGCAKPGFPGVYTRVYKYMEWICENTDLYEKH